MATRRPDDKVADKLAAIASDMISRNDEYQPLPEGELGRRVRITVIICVAAIAVSFAIAGIWWLAD